MKKNGYVLFWGADNKDGYLSNWYACDFMVDNKLFHSGEHWFMYAKAELFGDTAMQQYILTLDPSGYKDFAQYNAVLKRAGRGVSGFNDEIWEANKVRIVEYGLIEKFRQNKDLLTQLLATGDMTLVEASPYDTVWGIGMSAHEESATDPTKWKGENLLGEILMSIRKKLSK